MPSNQKGWSMALTILRSIWNFVKGFSENFFQIIPDQYLKNVWVKLLILAAISFLTYMDPWGLVSKFSGLSLFVSGICAFGNEIYSKVKSYF
jgi:hypothetical protein